MNINTIWVYFFTLMVKNNVDWHQTSLGINPLLHMGHYSDHNLFSNSSFTKVCSYILHKVHYSAQLRVT